MYGSAPVPLLGDLEFPQWQEFMHYMYLPVQLPKIELRRPGQRHWYLPKRLNFLHNTIYLAVQDAMRFKHISDPYIYVTARRGYATPGNPLNRPGWHCDDFGGTDLNYVWTDAFPTLTWVSNGWEPKIPTDDAKSMWAMDRYARVHPEYVKPMALNTLYRLDPYVIHAAPEIPEPGGMRSFLKISVSTHRYDLIGNSHNHGLNYHWPMYDREAMRNQPGGNRDYSERA